MGEKIEKMWNVSLTVEKKIVAPNRLEAKWKLVHEVEKSRLGLFGEPKETFSMVPTIGMTKPLLVDVSASVVKGGRQK